MLDIVSRRREATAPNSRGPARCTATIHHGGRHGESSLFRDLRPGLCRIRVDQPALGQYACSSCRNQSSLTVRRPRRRSRDLPGWRDDDYGAQSRLRLHDLSNRRAVRTSRLVTPSRHCPQRRVRIARVVRTEDLGGFNLGTARGVHDEFELGPPAGLTARQRRRRPEVRPRRAITQPRALVHGAFAIDGAASEINRIARSERARGSIRWARRAGARREDGGNRSDAEQ